MPRITPHAALPLLAAAVMACDRRPPVTAATPLPDPAIVAQLRQIGYRGPALLAERSITDDRGTRVMPRVLFLPQRGLAALRQADAAGAGATAAVQASLRMPSQVGEVTDPELVDANHNSPRTDLAVLVAPSRLNGANPAQVTVNFNFRFISYDFAKDEFYIVPGGTVHESVIRARDSSSGHWHGSRDTNQLRLPVRVGTLVPATGSFTGTWAAQWRVPEVSNEVNIRFRITEVGGPNDGETNWFYGLENDAIRTTGLVRLPADAARYVRVGGTDTHPEAFNDWGTADMVARIQAVANAYFTATSTPTTAGDITRVNDIALFFGGRFDVGRVVNRVLQPCSDFATQNCWQFSHFEHRLGTEVDINPQDRANLRRRATFLNALRGQFPSIFVEGNHYHARTPTSPYR